ncbi:MAG TPA: DUF58 domain-containing protein, partial [Burkholderiaceae bacterium]
MRLLPIPARAPVLALAGLSTAAAAALLLGAPLEYVALAAGVLLALGLVLAGFDLWQSLRLWRAAPLRIERNLPGAFSLGVPTVLT